jgi:hypothetical protein
VSPEDIARRQPVVASDLFRTMPGLRMERTSWGTYLTMRGITTDDCAPAVYIDGMYMSALSADDIDSWVRPDELAGIEVYAAGTAPVQYQPALRGCGSIVLWTRMQATPARRLSWAGRVLMILTVGALSVGLGALMVR